MQRSTDYILTTHTGSLPRPPELAGLLRAHDRGQPVDEQDFEAAIRQSVFEVARRQRDCGLAIINDGEQSKISFSGYRTQRLDGFELVDAKDAGPTYTMSSMEAADYPEFYSHWLGRGIGESPQVLCCTGRIGWRESATVEVKRDIDNLLAAGEEVKAVDLFMTGLSPACYAPPNLYYEDEDEYLTAIAEAMSVEFRAIVEAGLTLQIDAPDLGNTHRKRDYSLPQLLAHLERCVEVINHATRGLDADAIRVHVCCGADEAPHHRDVQLVDVAHILMKLRPAGLTVVGANGRHAHEWKVWADVKIPDGKVIVPGVIDSTTNIIEHPEAVAQRIGQYVSVLGRENVIAGVDCGFDTTLDMRQVDPKIAWAKLGALAEGAALASRTLW
jgi:5-methyltetrahydropteroyltriglutamate--homocysteine methyltransferase